MVRLALWKGGGQILIKLKIRAANLTFTLSLRIQIQKQERLSDRLTIFSEQIVQSEMCFFTNKLLEFWLLPSLNLEPLHN